MARREVGKGKAGAGTGTARCNAAAKVPTPLLPKVPPLATAVRDGGAKAMPGEPRGEAEICGGGKGEEARPPRERLGEEGSCVGNDDGVPKPRVGVKGDSSTRGDKAGE
mmetsp:Transcript_48679/g.128361  ORF Transcript_48679/g.128361 Transcript_48679/m.128361 type:complete len:109 (-) Transcript_48679:237-563(-)